MNPQPFVLAGKAMVRNPAGEYLFLRRSAASRHFAGKWEMPGGKMDSGETLEQCLVRETLEETGLTLHLEHVLGAGEGEIPTYRLAYLFLEGRVDSATVTLSDEHDQFAWVAPAAILRLDLCPAFVPFLRAFAANPRPASPTA